MLEPAIRDLATGKNFAALAVHLPNGEIANHVMILFMNGIFNAVGRLGGSMSELMKLTTWIGSTATSAAILGIVLPALDVQSRRLLQFSFCSEFV